MHDEDLTPEERAGFQALPREREPSELLEERVVRALKARGLLGPRPSWRLIWTPARTAIAAAAAMAIFTAGVFSGRGLESRGTGTPRDAEAAAVQMERSGAEYVEALRTLADAARSQEAAGLEKRRALAVNLLHAAADQMVRIAPEEPVAARILQGLDRAAITDTTALAAADSRNVIWF